MLIEDKRTTHCDRINNKCNVVTLLNDDMFMTKWEVLSDKSKNKVGKLTYLVSRSFIITRSTGHGSYFVRKLKNKHSAEQKFMAEDLYPLPPRILLSPILLQRFKYEILSY